MIKNILVLLSILFCLPMLPVCSDVFSPAFASSTPSAKIKVVRLGLLVRNSTNRAIPYPILFCPAPLETTANQKLLSLRASHPFELIGGQSGNRQMRFKFDEIPPFGTAPIIITAEFSMPASPETGDDDKKHAQMDQDIPQAIRHLAKKLQGAAPEDTAHNIYKWVSSNIHYQGYRRQVLDPEQLLKIKKGDCSESASLFTILCRAAGIEARMLAGYLCKGSCLLSEADFHNWAEFRLNGQWHLADPLHKKFMDPAPNYVAFAVVQPGLEAEPLFTIEGEGLQVGISR